jgi:hypothetical protein
MSGESDADFGDEPQERLPVPAVEPSTEAQLREFFHKYVNHQRLSEKCYLDGRYFWKVLSSYAGLIPSEMYVRINERPAVAASELLARTPLDLDDPMTARMAPQISSPLAIEPEGVMATPFQLLLTFDGEDLSRTKCYPERYRLIKLIIDVATNPQDVRGTVHSNLIYIDTKKKTVKRFEPLFDAPYLHPVDKALKAFFNENLPEYHYTVSPEHPQKTISNRCTSRGMCAAFVLKKAMLLLAHNPHRHDCQVEYQEAKGMLGKWLSGWSTKKHKKHQHREFVVHSQADYDREELKILQFADAIEAEYGRLPGVPELEFGPGYGDGGEIGEALAAGVGGLIGGALASGALGGGYGGYYNPYAYAPVAGPYGYAPAYYNVDPYAGYYPPQLYSYGPSIVVGNRPYGRSWGYYGEGDDLNGYHHHPVHHYDGGDNWNDGYGYRREYGHNATNYAVTGAAVGGLGSLLLGSSIGGALLAGLAGGTTGYLLSDPYSQHYSRPGYRHHEGYRYYS